MSDEAGSFWLGLTEKFFGLIVIIVSAIMLYLTATSTTVLGAYTGLFAFLGVVILAAGLFLLIAKPPE